jgi:hypothetical protein
MRMKPEALLIGAMAVFAATGITAAVVLNRDASPPDRLGGSPDASDPEAAAAWFQGNADECTPERVDGLLSADPAPPTLEGTWYEAACLALAAQTSKARRAIDGLPESERGRAADVVFAAGHPRADQGDELAVGPLMELVVEYRPDQYMALYHAGAAASQRGDERAVRRYLGHFLEVYGFEDAWRANARTMLERIDR